MNGKTTKYYYNEKNKQSTVTIPVSIAKSLNWENKDEINVLFEVKEGKKGIFLLPVSILRYFTLRGTLRDPSASIGRIKKCCLPEILSSKKASDGRIFPVEMVLN